jgi:hypothetical protein
MQEVSMPSFASAIDKPMLFQIGDRYAEYCEAYEKYHGRGKL